MRFPISLNSFSPNPLLVPAGDPSLIPEVTKGLSGSNGTPFLLQVIPAFSSDLAAAIPVSYFGLKSTTPT